MTQPAGLPGIVPWGRDFDEYVAMFALSAADLNGRLLGCGDGPASFNATLTARGGKVVSLDPVYAHDGAAIAERIAATRDAVLAQTEANREAFVWSRIPSIAALDALRTAAMAAFLADYETGRAEGRYVAGTLPDLPFSDDSFDLALCSHLLFLYSEQLSAETHVAAIQAMLRVAPEARIFPLLGLDGAPSPHVALVRTALAERGLTSDVVPVAYEFQRGGNAMLVIRRQG